MVTRCFNPLTGLKRCNPAGTGLYWEDLDVFQSPDGAKEVQPEVQAVGGQVLIP